MRAVSIAVVFAVGLASPLSASDATTDTDGAGTISTSSGGCKPEISCGFGCRAELAGGFCVTLGESSPGFLGVKLTVACKICDCMYVAPGPNGRVLVRRVEIGCDAGVDGLELF
ncbi:MAG: hypothetical protein MJB57_08055 [Gemmatimonadetes bacterium]|nr:hypothetical protein [Gemmatimonadota bacterium]